MTATRQKIKQPPKRRIKMSTEDKIYNIIGLSSDLILMSIS